MTADSARRTVRCVAMAVALAVAAGSRGAVASRPQSADGLVQLSAEYVGGIGDNRLISSQTDNAGSLYLFGQAQVLPSTGPQVRIVPAPQTAETGSYCVVHKRALEKADSWSLYFEGFSSCAAMAVSPGGAVHLALQSRAGNFDGVAQLVT